MLIWSPRGGRRERGGKVGVAMVYSSHLNIILLNGTSCNHRCHAVSSKTVGGGGGEGY